MFSNVLIPVDFTSFSLNALERAVAIARYFEVGVTAIHVLVEDAATAPSADAARSRLLELLHEVNAPSPRAIVVIGDPATEIVKLAVAAPTDLLVMPSQGRTGAAEGTCGSVSKEVLCHAPGPVIVVPSTAGARPADAGGAFRRIACAIDFSPASLKALRHAGELAGAAGAPLLVVHVLPAAAASRTDAAEGQVMWRHRLHVSAHCEIPEGVCVEERLKTGDAAEEILRLADEEQSDLIVIGGHKGNPPGCVMNAIVTRSRCPVLVVRVSR
jgi:nucleotide-binding universal stress UspA family protein